MILDVIIPSFNEEKYIVSCIDSVNLSCKCAGLKPKEFNIFLIDGGSSDSTIELAEGLALENLYTFKNEKQILASAWNIGLEKSKSKFVLAMNAHATLEENYVSKCLGFFENCKDKSVVAVGGALTNASLSTEYKYTSVAKIMGSVFGVGNSKFRTSLNLQMPQEVDTLHCPIFEKQKLGGQRFDEKLIRSQDFKFNHELTQSGKKLMLLPDVFVNYFNGRSLHQLPKYAFKNGYWVTYPLKFDLVPSWRHVVPMLFSLYIILLPILSYIDWKSSLIIVLYFLLNTVFSVLLSSSFAEIIFIQISFLFYHFFYGLGSLVGLADLLNNRVHSRV